MTWFRNQCHYSKQIFFWSRRFLKHGRLHSQVPGLVKRKISTQPSLSGEKSRQQVWNNRLSFLLFSLFRCKRFEQSGMNTKYTQLIQNSTLRTDRVECFFSEEEFSTLILCLVCEFKFFFSFFLESKLKFTCLKNCL